jgi:oligoribonuclease NrnB/cAMP/cGMP phosphodiesterase (DHH superfamily)
MSKRLVIYHGGCRDGFCAAWVLAARYGAENVDFHAGYYGQPPPDFSGRDVVVVDFSYPRATMEQIRAEAESLTWLDHHKTAQADALDFKADHVTFDMERSGAGIAWDHYFPGQPRPWIVDYTEDRDLWRFKLPNAHELCAYLSVLTFDFDTWSAHATRAREQYIPAGSAVMAKTAQYVREVAKNARRVRFEGHDIPLFNAPQVDISELGDHLAQGETFAMGWWQRADAVFQYSLRSRGDFDVSAIAKKYGGGGHKNAAGFQSPTLLDLTAGDSRLGEEGKP